MTLVEVMIAVTLLGFVMIAVTTITADSQNTKERVTQTDKDNMQIETVFSRLDWDFSQIWSPLYFTQRFQGSLDPSNAAGIEEIVYLYENHPRFRLPSKEGLPIPIFRSREKSEIIFLTVGNRRKLENQKQSNFMWVRYFLGDTPSDSLQDTTGSSGGSDSATTTKKSLLRQVFTEDVWSKEEFDFEDTRSSVVLENVEKLEFQFWSPQNKRWESNIKAVTDGDHLLRGLRVDITWYDSRGTKRSAQRWLRPSWQTWLPKDNTTGGAQGGAAGGVPGGGLNGGTQGTTNGGNQGTTNGGDPGDFQ